MPTDGFHKVQILLGVVVAVPIAPFA